MDPATTLYDKADLAGASAGSLMTTDQPAVMREAITHPEAAVDRQCADLDCALDNLQGMFIELDQRLRPVMGLNPPPEGDPVRSVDESQSRLAQFVESRALRVWQMGRDMRALIDRLEV